MKIQKIIAYLLAISGLLILLPQISGADPLDNWHWRSPLPQGNDLYAVAYGNGVFVAVGEGGTILTSPDGVTWTQRASGVSSYPWPYKSSLFQVRPQLRAVTYGNDIFVVVGENGTILTSQDGTTWTKRVSGITSTLYEVTYGNDMFVAVGGNSYYSYDCYCPCGEPPCSNCCPTGRCCPAIIVTSPDGINWTSKILGPVTYGLTGVASGNGIFVASGPHDSSFISSNGEDWNSIPGGLRVLTYAGGVFWGASYGSVQTSPDGMTWTVRTSISADSLNAMSYSNGTFVIVGAYVIATSTDGETWTDRISFVVGDGENNRFKQFTGVAYGNGTFVVVGLYGTILTSPDGAEWKAQTSRVTSGVFADAAYGDGTYVAVGVAPGGPGSGGVIVTSFDGVNWTLRSSGRSSGIGFDLHAVTYGKGIFVAGGYDSHTEQIGFLTSPDGITWTANTSPEYGTNGEHAITYGNDKFVAVGYDTIRTSLDGVAWTAKSFEPPALNPVSLNAVTYGNGTFVAVGACGDMSGVPILTSQDAVNWTQRWGPADKVRISLAGVTYGNGIFVAVGEGGTIITSPDGVVWTERSTGLVPYYYSSLNRVAYGNGIFVATEESYGTILTSSDGITWTQSEEASIGVRAVVYANGTFIGVGSLGTIVQSDPVGCTFPVIITQPQTQTILSGEDASLSVIAFGSTPLIYQWYQGPGGDISKPIGTDSSSFTTPALTQATSYWVRVSNSCGYKDSDTATVTIAIYEITSPPNAPDGPTIGNKGESYTYSTGGSTSNLGHAVEYQFDWKGDGSDLSNWGSDSQSKTWTTAGLYNVRARARCAQDVSVISDWSTVLTIRINLPEISVTPAAYDFGDTKVKKGKKALFSVKNEGTVNLTISSSIVGADASIFRIRGGGGSKTIKPGNALSINVAFRPTTAGSKQATLRITSNDPGVPTIDIPLNGTGM